MTQRVPLASMFMKSAQGWIQNSIVLPVTVYAEVWTSAQSIRQSF